MLMARGAMVRQVKGISCNLQKDVVQGKRELGATTMKATCERFKSWYLRATRAKESLPEYVHLHSSASGDSNSDGCGPHPKTPKSHAIRQFPVVPLLLVMISTSRGPRETT